MLTALAKVSYSRAPTILSSPLMIKVGSPATVYLSPSSRCSCRRSLYIPLCSASLSSTLSSPASSAISSTVSRLPISLPSRK
ncbi:MAG: hypothetical protein JL50_06860 [Peptococcaceae bacterium BICA1-7]|nr:MAG: hypothetical protein JL50_06860 [Peptococcaceae bacterium BICA1-7]